MALLIAALLLTYDRSMDLLYGRISLEGALTPGWINFATTHTELFAVILIVATLLFGGAFVTFMENV